MEQQFYVPKHFQAHEYVDPITEKEFSILSFTKMDPRILWTIDRIRERYGRPVYINTYNIPKYVEERGKSFRFRGYRPHYYMNGADYSEHRHGRAIDFDVDGMTAEEVRQDILANQFDEDFKYITCIEANVNWVHIDCRNYPKEEKGILVVKP